MCAVFQHFSKEDIWNKNQNEINQIRKENYVQN